MNCYNQTFETIIYLLLIVLLLSLIILVIKTISTVKKVDRLVDDAQMKVSKLDTLFAIIDKSTDALSLLSDSIVSLIVGTIHKIVKKKEDDKNE